MSLAKKDWILLILKESPLDRIQIMKALFLIWHRSGRNVPDYFQFMPYLYGPCSFEVYAALTDMESDRLIARPPHPVQKWANYYLTQRGENQAEQAVGRVPSERLRILKEVVKDVCEVGFYALLKKVYAEAPDFAAESIFREVVER